jgi:hypothetical protein
MICSSNRIDFGKTKNRTKIQSHICPKPHVSARDFESGKHAKGQVWQPNDSRKNGRKKDV